MKKTFFTVSVLLICLSSCTEVFNKGSEKGNAKPLADIENLISDYSNWWSYQYYNIALASDFHALNEDSKEIGKDQFLNKLTTGNYIPIEVQSNDLLKAYKLFELPKNSDEAISNTIRNISSQAYKLFKMEGTKFPDFNVVDLNGIEYNNENLKGKTTVFKTWFIACTSCIAEMPELNEFVQKYKNEDGIQFLSLALDTKPLLLSFLNRIEFEYAIIGEQKELIQEKLNLAAYPTHIVVDENGNIKRVFDNASELISYIEKDTSLKRQAIKALPSKLPSSPASMQYKATKASLSQ